MPRLCAGRQRRLREVFERIVRYHPVVGDALGTGTSHGDDAINSV